MTRLTPLFFLTLASLAIASPLNPGAEVFPRQDPTPTTTTTSPSTTTSSAAIATKTIAGCNIQGIAGPTMVARTLGGGPASDVISCQSSCRGVTACISFSWEPSTTNCMYYNSSMDDYITGDTTGYLILSNTTGVFYSDKYPSDGSWFCYSLA